MNRIGVGGYRSDWDLAEAPRPAWELTYRNAVQTSELALLDAFGCAPPDELEQARARRRRRARRLRGA